MAGQSLGDLFVKLGIQGDAAFAQAMQRVGTVLDATGQDAETLDKKLGGLGKGAQDLLGKQVALSKGLKSSQEAVRQLKEAYDKGLISEQAMARGIADLERAFNKANPTIKASAGLSDQLTEALNRASIGGVRLGDAFSGIGTGRLAGAAAVAVIAAAAREAWNAGRMLEEARVIIQRATGATGEALQGLEESFRRLYASSGQSGDVIAKALGKLRQETHAPAADLEDLTKSFLKFAKLTGGDVYQSIDKAQQIFAAFGVEVKDQALGLDMIYAAMRETGMSADEVMTAMDEMGSTLRNVGFSFKESIALIAQFDNAGLHAVDVMKGLNNIFAKAREVGKAPGLALTELIERLNATKSRTEALSIVMDYDFTKNAASRFVDAARNGALAITPMKEKMDEAAGSIETVSRQTDTLSESWTKLMHAISVSPVGDLGNLMVGGVKGQIQALTGLLRGVTVVIDAIKSKYISVEDIARNLSLLLSAGQLTSMKGLFGLGVKGGQAAGSPIPGPEDKNPTPLEIGRVEAPPSQAELVAAAASRFQGQVQELNKQLATGEILWSKYRSELEKASEEFRKIAGSAADLKIFRDQVANLQRLLRDQVISIQDYNTELQRLSKQYIEVSRGAGQAAVFLEEQRAKQLAVDAELRDALSILQGVAEAFRAGTSSARAFAEAQDLVAKAAARAREELQRERDAEQAEFSRRMSERGVTPEEMRQHEQQQKLFERKINELPLPKGAGQSAPGGQIIREYAPDGRMIKEISPGAGTTPSFLLPPMPGKIGAIPAGLMDMPIIPRMPELGFPAGFPAAAASVQAANAGGSFTLQVNGVSVLDGHVMDTLVDRFAERLKFRRLASG